MARITALVQPSEAQSSRNPSTPTEDTAPFSEESSPDRSPDSDKENRTNSRRSPDRRKGGAEAMSARTGAEAGSSKKRRRGEDDGNIQTQAAHRRELNRLDRRHYDPDQKPEERRQIRKDLRSLYDDLNESKSDYVRPENNGLQEMLRRQDEIFKAVRQPAEATIDSRLLVDLADTAAKKTNNLTVGSASTGVDVDDFITKCIGFMKRGDELDEATARHAPSSTATQRQRRRNRAEDDDEDDEPMNWAYLGQNACFLYNSRPCLTGFLLGPLSVQKKHRQPTQRKAREARTEGTQAVRPIELTHEDLEQQESASLTVVCTEIARLLTKAQEHGSNNADRDFELLGDEATQEKADEILRRNNIADNGCVPLFKFCVNPQSFGQTVENMFYVSFLIKEGKVGLDFDSHGLPTLGIAASRTVSERQETQRNQAVFTLDFDIWEDIIKSYGIQDCIIPHRKEENYDDGIVDYGRMEDDADREVEEDSDAYS
ncbi:hypothetical protein B0A52_02114 [Exophiala mesophila]|uniref:Non-structural maintenance of chromosomes element 4 n=1 Tax=Exophiala mesophila TaxID=212818 RepID=A0A438NEX6_EXOME|nr:hypothetical protein B0A52_02114 [Exophiala mesophila]